MRRIFSLNSKWKYFSSKSEIDPLKVEFQDEISVPSCVEEFSYCENKHLYFSKRFSTKVLSKKRYFLNFEAVDYFTEVYLNDQFLGSHLGGYTPFSFEITNLLKEENELRVHIFDPAGKDATEILHGKQNGIPDWYGNTSGIWRDVYIEEKGQNFFKNVKVDASYLAKELKIRIGLENKKMTNIKVSLMKEDKAILRKNLDVKSEKLSTQFDLEEIEPWSPESPRLYDLRLELVNKDEILDTWESKIGFRDIEAQNGKIFLNGRELFIRGVLDQDFYPISLYTTPSRSYLKDEFLKAKEMGLNLLRCHIKVPDRRYLELADEMGLLVWEEIPNFDKFSNRSIKEFESTISEIIDRDYNHPSFVFFTLINEGWGLDLSKGEQRRWLRKTYKMVKKIAGNRLVVDNSPCNGNFHIETDINDFHFYRSLDHLQEWNSDILRFASGDMNTFFVHGDSKETRKAALIVSEFGVWGLPPFIRDIKRMNRPFREISETIPEGVEDRFINSSLSRHFKDYETFATLTQKEQFNALKYQIEEMRLHDSIKGYVITEFTDVFWEANGLLDMHRRAKWHFDLLKMINTPILLIPRASKYSYFIGDTVNVDLAISNHSRIAGKMKLHVKVEDMELLSKDIDVANNVSHHKMTLKTKKMQGLKKIWFELENRDGVIVSKNYMDIAVLEMPGFRDEGRNVEIVYLEKEGEYTFEDVKINVLKKKDMLSGDWITNFNWMDPDIFKDISNNGVMDMRHMSLLKNDLMMRVTGDAKVIAGLTYGWIYGEFAYAVIIKGKDHLRIVTTFSMSKEEPISLVMQKVFERLKMFNKGQ